MPPIADAVYSKPGYCAVVRGECPYSVERLRAGLVLAYPFDPRHKEWAETVGAAARGIGIGTYVPHKQFSSNYVICDVCKEIRAREIHVSETTVPNWNVLFESGFAFGSGKLVLLAEDANSAASRGRLVFPELLRALYHESGDVLGPLRQAQTTQNLQIDSITATEDPEQVYFVDPGIVSDQVTELKKSLKRLAGRRYAAPSGGLASGGDSLHSDLYDIRAAGSVVGLLLRDGTTDQDILNAKASFLLGVATALEKPVLILIQEPLAKGLTDLRGVAKPFGSVATMRTVIAEWARSELSSNRPRRTQGPAIERGDVLTVDLGNAWAERDISLDRYFLETAHYRRAKEATTSVFLGRRGSGKSALAIMLADAKIQGPKPALRLIRPEEFEMQELQDAYRGVIALRPDVHWQLMLGAAWRYLLVSQLAWTYLTYFSGRPDPPPEIPELEALVQMIPHEDDFVDAVMAVTKFLADADDATLRQFMGEMSRQRVYKPFAALSRTTPARLILDNLDASWESSHQDSQYVLASLIRETERLNQKLEQRASVVLFLRSDIYDVVKLADPDVDKQSRDRLRWDTAALLEIVGLRLKYLMDLRRASPHDAWFAIFPDTVRGIASPDFMVGLTLRRPRELIKLCAAAIEVAQSRRASQISETDVLAALETYSNDLLTDLNGEYLIELPDLFYFISEFSGQSWPKGLDDMRGLIRDASQRETAAGRNHEWHRGRDGNVDHVLQKLFEIGAVGLVGDHDEVFSYDRDWVSARAQTRRSAGTSYRKGRTRVLFEEPLVVLHPGLRPCLGAMEAVERGPYIESETRRLGAPKGRRRPNANN